MTARTQESPFRETAWDQRLDKMLDDLKTTVNPNDERTSSRRDNSLVSSFRSTSRSDSRNSNRSCVEDGGLMKHHHKEYTSPDKTTRVVTDQFEYETQEPSKYQKKVMKSTYSNYKVSGELSSDLDDLRHGPDPAVMAAARSTSDYTDNTKGPTNHYSTNSYTSNSSKKYGMTNGKPSYDDDLDAEIHEPMGGEVRKIVWRNRFEKTYEGQDGTPSITIEEEARRRNLRNQYDKTTTTSSTLSSFQPQPPQISPGGQSWADPIPMPTPPQVSPKGEPGVAYVYTYGQSGSQVQHLPPLNYVTMPPGGGTSIPPSEGAPSPTPSGTQPIIYHYSYHYTLQPGQTIPEGVPQPPGGHHSQPALQVAPTSTRPLTDVVPVKSGTQPASTLVSSSYDYKKRTEHTTERSDTTNTNTNTNTNLHHHHHHHHPPGGTPSSSLEPKFPRGPYDEPPESGRYPRGGDPTPTSPDGSNRNISITVNKSSSHVTHSKDYPGSGGPSTSTPFPTRSRSSSPDRYPRGPGTSTPHGTITHVTRTTNYSDSLDRLRRPPHEGMPFPDTSPIKPSENSKIPKRIDDLMTSFSDSEDGPNQRFPNGNRHPNGPKASPEREPLITSKISANNADLSLSERKLELKKEESKNVAGPPVYYPPGHHQLFDESMHTMTLKENK